jgi:hypothetical protein
VAQAEIRVEAKVTCDWRNPAFRVVDFPAQDLLRATMQKEREPSRLAIPNGRRLPDGWTQP